MVSRYEAGWYCNAATPLIIWPFAMFAGGIMQSVAAVASLRARDGIAVAVHTAWGSFWVAWGVLQILVTVGLLPAISLGAASPSFAFWFIALTLVTGWGALAALAQNMVLFITLGVLTAASAVTAAAFYAGSLGTAHVGGWLYVISAAAAWLVGGALVLENSFGRSIVPLGEWSKRANIPGRRSPTRSPTRRGCPASRWDSSRQ